MSTGRLEAIAIRSASRAPMLERERAQVSCAAGVDGDFRGRPGDRQVTVLSSEAWRRACDHLGQSLPWTLRRANLLVSGLEIAHTTGARLEIGDATLEVTGETDPCQVMDRQHPGLRAALGPDWRGGITCRVVRGGDVGVGDGVVLRAGGEGA